MEAESVSVGDLIFWVVLIFEIIVIFIVINENEKNYRNE